MRPHVAAAARQADWMAIRQIGDDILATGDPNELRILGMAFQYTGDAPTAARLYRRAEPHLGGRSHTAILVDIASVLCLITDYGEAQEWLDRYFSQPDRFFDGSAWECKAFCLWKVRAPWQTVDAAYQQAALAWGDDTGRIARMSVDWVQMLIEHRALSLAEERLAPIAALPSLAGQVLSCQAHLAEARGDHALAWSTGITALQVLSVSVDKFGSILREICCVYLLLARTSDLSERSRWASAAEAAALVLSAHGLMKQAQSLRREADECTKRASGS